jgi:hypothetical protein
VNAVHGLLGAAARLKYALVSAGHELSMLNIILEHVSRIYQSERVHPMVYDYIPRTAYTSKTKAQLVLYFFLAAMVFPRRPLSIVSIDSE